VTWWYAAVPIGLMVAGFAVCSLGVAAAEDDPAGREVLARLLTQGPDHATMERELLAVGCTRAVALLNAGAYITLAGAVVGVVCSGAVLIS
jgi:hypothetical protein